MDKESAQPQGDGEGDGAPDSGGNGGQVKEEELNRMSAFKDFISNLHELEELGGSSSSTS